MPRGPSGSAGGLSRREVDRRLIAVIIRLHSESGLTFTSEQAQTALLDMFDGTTAEATAVRKVLVGLPGVRERVDGSFVLPAMPTGAVKHRHWRFTLGQVNTLDAALLHAMILDASLSANVSTRNLTRLKDRLAAALTALLGELWQEQLLPDDWDVELAP